MNSNSFSLTTKKLLECTDKILFVGEGLSLTHDNPDEFGQASLEEICSYIKEISDREMEYYLKRQQDRTDLDSLK